MGKFKFGDCPIGQKFQVSKSLIYYIHTVEQGSIQGIIDDIGNIYRVRSV